MLTLQEYEIAAKAGQDAVKQLPHLQKQLADKEAAAAVQEVRAETCRSCACIGCDHCQQPHQGWHVRLTARTCGCCAMFHLQAVFQDLTNKLQEQAAAQALDRQQVRAQPVWPAGWRHPGPHLLAGCATAHTVTVCKKSDCRQLDRWLHVPMLLLQVEALLAEKQQLLRRQEALQAEVEGLVAAHSALQGQLGKQRHSPRPHATALDWGVVPGMLVMVVIHTHCGSNPLMLSTIPALTFAAMLPLCRCWRCCSLCRRDPRAAVPDTGPCTGPGGDNA